MLAPSSFSWHDPVVTRSTVSLFRRIESALETIALGSTPLETIHRTADFLTDNFAEDLGIKGGRIYAQDDGSYELVETFGDASREPIGLRVWKTYPPFRSAADIEGVLHAIYDGTVDAIASDHSPHHADEKELDFADAPFGIVGLETVVGLGIDRLIHGKVIGIAQLVRLFSTGPAEVFNLPGGSLREGEPADLTLLDMRTRWTVDPAKFKSKACNTPFAGRQLKGAPVVTIVGGKIVWKSKS